MVYGGPVCGPFVDCGGGRIEDEEGEEERALEGAVVTTGVMAGVGGFEFAGDGG